MESMYYIGLNQGERIHGAELTDSHLRQIRNLQSRGTGALCVQRGGGERSSRELQNILRVRVNEISSLYESSPGSSTSLFLSVAPQVRKIVSPQ